MEVMSSATCRLSYMVFMAQSPVDWLVDRLSDEKDDNYRGISSIYLLAVSPVIKWIWVTHTISHAHGVLIIRPK